MIMKAIPGFKNYFAGDDGEIYSMMTWPRNAKPPKEPRKLRANRGGGYGYRYVSLGQGNTRSVHSLVCEAFHGPRPEGMEVCHGVRGRWDNLPDNLSWGTRAKNHGPDKLRDGTLLRGEKHAIHKLTEAAVRRIRSQAGTKTHKQLAAENGVSRRHVGAIISRTWWGWLT